MRVDKTIKAEEKRVHALITRKGVTWDAWAEGFLKGAQQALAWARADHAAAPSTSVTEAMAKSERDAVDDGIADNIEAGVMEVAGEKDGETTYRLTDAGRQRMDDQCRAAGFDPKDPQQVREYMKALGLDVDALDAMRQAKRRAGL